VAVAVRAVAIGVPTTGTHPRWLLKRRIELAQGVE
jgi:hypothetical protein